MRTGDTSMAANAVKRTAAEGGTVRGVNLTFPAPAIIEVLACLDLDFVYLDGEHGSFDLRDIEACCIAAERHGMVPIARIPDQASATISRFLDRGVRGIVVPHVDSVAEARSILDAAYFAPLGNRSSGAGRPYYLATGDLPAHLARCNETVAVALLIESVAGLEAAPDIAALPGVDYLSFGVNDLAQALGHPGQPKHPNVLQRLDAVRARINLAGKPVREDFMRFAWINQIILDGAKASLGNPELKLSP